MTWPRRGDGQTDAGETADVRRVRGSAVAIQCFVSLPGRSSESYGVGLVL